MKFLDTLCAHRLESLAGPALGVKELALVLRLTLVEKAGRFRTGQEKKTGNLVDIDLNIPGLLPWGAYIVACVCWVEFS